MHKDKLKNKNIVFLGLIQNSEETLKYFLKFYTKIKKHYKNCYLIIGENGSKDDTLRLLKNFKKKEKNFIIVDTSFSEKYEYRLEKMSNLRQSLKDKIKTFKKKMDFACWFDLDDVIKNSLSPKKFYNSNLKLINKSNLFGISSGSKPYYYDILSFRKKNFFTKNIYPISLEKNIFTGYRLRKEYIYDIQKKITHSKNLETISSFNGMCIYHFKYFKLGSYLDKKRIIRSQVEHVTFNKKIYALVNKYILIDNDFCMNLPYEHKPYNNFLGFCFGKSYLYFSNFIKNLI